jgi:calreticulin
MPPGFKSEEFNGDTIYNVMFGPDVCGSERRTHVILNYKNENHLIKKSIAPKTDQLTHLYTLWIKPDQTYTVFIDLEEEASGKIVDDWAVLPPQNIRDPDAKKPEDWVDDSMMDDPEDKKPEDWDDQPETIPDPEAKKPEDWDDEDDGEWEPPTIPNPDYKGVWTPKRIKNPDYKGPWVHPEIPNPEYQYDSEIYAYKSAFIGFDLWQVKAGTIFDNILVTDSIEEAKDFAKETFVKDQSKEKAAKEELDKKEEERLEKIREDIAKKDAIKAKAGEDADKAAEEAKESAAEEASEEEHVEL